VRRSLSVLPTDWAGTLSITGAFSGGVFRSSTDYRSVQQALDTFWDGGGAASGKLRPPSWGEGRFIVVPVIVVAFVLLVGGAWTHVGWAQPDSVRTEILKEKGFPPGHSPRGALWRTAAVPGWGQYYNRQYYKIPFIYAGLAALGARIYRAHRRYLLFDRAHLYGIGQEREGENPYLQYERQFRDVKEQVFLGQAVRLEVVRNQRDKFRRQRDLTILGVGLFYALTLLDAYVSAHLLTFDVGGDLAVRVQPTGTVGSILAQRMGTDARAHRYGSPGSRAVTGGPGMRVHVRF
jgi:hypothetical protein